MKGVTKAAKLASSRSQKCGTCPIRLRCDPAMIRICHDAFIEGFKKGAKAAEKQIKRSKLNEVNNLPFPYHWKMVQYK